MGGPAKGILHGRYKEPGGQNKASWLYSGRWVCRAMGLHRAAATKVTVKLRGCSEDQICRVRGYSVLGFVSLHGRGLTFYFDRC